MGKHTIIFLVLIITGFVLSYESATIFASTLDVILVGNTVLFLAIINRDKLKLKWKK